MELSTPLETIIRLKVGQKRALTRLGIKTVADLLYHFPTRYSEVREFKTVAALSAGDAVTLYGTISKLKTKKAYRSKVPMATAIFSDPTGSIPVTWFNQPFVAKTLHEGQHVQLSGKITEGTTGVYVANPEFSTIETLPIDSHDSLFQGVDGESDMQFPIYRETRGITSRFMYHAIRKLFSLGILDTITDPIPEDILKQYSLPKIQTALVWIHSPKRESDARAARKRFAFEEVLYIQLSRLLQRRMYEKEQSYEITVSDDDINAFIDRFPFTLTKAQRQSVNDILQDVTEPSPMRRLLEGDVGSGKTAVAATVTYGIIKNRPAQQDFGHLQVAYMAPTEILATQLFESFISYFKHTGVQICLITGSGCRKFPSKVDPETWTNISRTQLLKWVENGEIPIVVGTHSLIQKTVRFENLALAIIDEQHRFGTKQRMQLAKKHGRIPHLLSMTATPIPRTLALTVYGDLDLSVLDELPQGRKYPHTELVPPEDRKETYQAVRTQLESGRQAYVICPRINEPDPDKETALLVKSVESEMQRLQKKIFPEYTVAQLHGKLSKKEKEETMQRFAAGDVDILVATSVVEVGVNVPNASTIIIEGAERFGLAQLHQLRGRVMRSSHQPYCYLFTDTENEQSLGRLHALKSAKSGFDLAELDLQLRGAGELAGGKQWGISDVGMEAIRNLKMVEAARKEAQKIINVDDSLSSFPLLKEQIEQERYNIHFE